MQAQTPSRRSAILGALVLPLAIGHLARAQETPAQSPPALGDGIAGGGTFESGTGPADFTLAAFAREPGDGMTEYIGTFTLQDSSDAENPLTMTSESLSGYSATDNEAPGLRQVVGWAMANESGSFPFIVEVDGTIDPASGTQTILVLFGDTASTLLGGGAGSVCDCGGFDYRVKGTVVNGGVTLFDIPPLT